MILPKKLDLDKARAQERKQEIDNGVALATSVDKLRQLKAREEQGLKEWRESSLKLVQGEIDEIITQKNSILGELKTLEETRKELLKPLDMEWTEINKVKEEIKELTQLFNIKELQRKEEEQKIEEEKKKISEIVSQITQNEKETEKSKESAKSLKELAQKEYEIAREEHNTQTDTVERKLSDLSQREKEYEVALKIIEIREKEVKEKESDIINREKHLASQQVALRIAYEKIHNVKPIN